MLLQINKILVQINKLFFEFDDLQQIVIINENVL